MSFIYMPIACDVHFRRFVSAHLQDAVEVFRRESSNSPGLGDPSYDWTETVYLNMILQQLEYTLTCAICSKTSDKEDVVIHRKVSQVCFVKT